MSLGRIIYADQRVFIGGGEVAAVQSCTTAADLGYEPLFVAGTGFYDNAVVKPPSATINVSALITSEDDLIAQNILYPMTGFYAYKTVIESDYHRLAFSAARIKSYVISCAVGNLPKIDFGMEIVGDWGGSGSVNITEKDYSSVEVSRPQDITIEGFVLGDSNRVQSVDYSLSINYNNRSRVGRMFFDDREVQHPIILTTKFSMEIDDFVPEMVQELICGNPELDLLFTLQKCGTGPVIRQFASPNARLTDVSMKGEIAGNMTAEVSYESIINDTGSLSDILIGDI